MHSVLIFIFSSLLSFIGSLQLGAVNLFVINSSLQQGKRTAHFIAIGGVVPEFIYCALAVYAGNLFLVYPAVEFVFKLMLILVFSIIGVTYFLKKHKHLELNTTQSPATAHNGKSFLKGFTLAILNPQLLPFWLFVLVWFNSIHVLEVKTSLSKLAYISGAGFGALILLITLAETVSKYRARVMIYLNNKYYYKILAMFFFAVALQQFIAIV